MIIGHNFHNLFLTTVHLVTHILLNNLISMCIQPDNTIITLCLYQKNIQNKYAQRYASYNLVPHHHYIHRKYELMLRNLSLLFCLND